MTKTQTRGICQVCGRDHAVVRGAMSKHGYKVSEHGWFVGVCSGNRYEPMQIDRSVADGTVTAVRKDCTLIRARAAKMAAGEINPEFCRGPYDIKAREYTKVLFENAPSYAQDEARKSAVFAMNRRAEAGEQFASQLEALANEYHGQPLRVVPVESGPAPVQIGERRQGARRVLTCTRVDGARVYWKDAEGYKGWTGSQAWRKLEVVA